MTCSLLFMEITMVRPAPFKPCTYLYVICFNMPALILPVA